MNKKGFTLIELLAVILILGIIALIAVPTVSGIIKDAKKGAFETTLKNIEKKVNDTCSIQNLKNQEVTSSYTITNGVISPSLDIKGNLPNGTINVNNNCDVTYVLTDNTYTGTKADADTDVVISQNNSTPVETVKITYYYKGSIYREVTVKKNSIVDLIEAPVVEGYNFKNWSTIVGYCNIIDNTKIQASDDVSLTSNYEADPGTIPGGDPDDAPASP